MSNFKQHTLHIDRDITISISSIDTFSSGNVDEDAVNATARIIQQHCGGSSKWVSKVGVVGVKSVLNEHEFYANSDLLHPPFAPTELFFITPVFDEFVLFYINLTAPNLVLVLVDPKFTNTTYRNQILSTIGENLCKIISTKFNLPLIAKIVSIDNVAKEVDGGNDTAVFVLLQIQNKMLMDLFLEKISPIEVQEFKKSWKQEFIRRMQSILTTIKTPSAPPLESLWNFKLIPWFMGSGISGPSIYPDLGRIALHQKTHNLPELKPPPNFGGQQRDHDHQTVRASSESLFAINPIQQLYEEYVLTSFPKLETHLKIHQLDVIKSVLDGYDVICLLPTAYGKTLAMLVPTLIQAQKSMERCVHVIVSPLIALSEGLMEYFDQIGLTGFHMNGDSFDIQLQLQQMYSALPMAKVLHVITSPELLKNLEFKDFLRTHPIRGFSVDEGHVVSLWSEDFRKEYGNLHEVRAFIKCPVSVFSATVTPVQKEIIMEKVGIREDMVVEIIVSPNRPEIYFETRTRKPALGSLVDIISSLKRDKLKAKKAIIFVRTKTEATNLLLDIRDELPNFGKVKKSIPKYIVDMYSGNTCHKTRRILEQDFRKENSTIRLLVCTSAFGMGLNIKGLHTVYILDLPDTLGEILQLGGRASRDGLPGNCVIFVPKTSTNPIAVALNQCSCIKELLLAEFCTPTIPDAGEEGHDDGGGRCCNKHHDDD